MAVVDASALIPLSWTGRLDLLEAVSEELRTTTVVRDEVLTGGKPGTAALESFIDEMTVHEIPSNAEAIAEMEGIAVGDASVILLAERTDERLVANDKGLITVARSHGIECWWVTTVLLRCAKTGDLSASEATDLLQNLVDRGMNLHPSVYANVHDKLRELGD